MKADPERRAPHFDVRGLGGSAAIRQLAEIFTAIAKVRAAPSLRKSGIVSRYAVRPT